MSVIDRLLNLIGLQRAKQGGEQATDSVEWSAIAAGLVDTRPMRPRLDAATAIEHTKGPVFIAINATAEKIAEQRAKVVRVLEDGTREPAEPSHPLVQLLREVNPIWTEWDLWYYTVAFRLAAGTSYIWKRRDSSGTVRELWVIPPQWVKVVPSRTTFIDGYVVENMWSKPVYLPASDVVRIAEPTLDWRGVQRFYGQARIERVAEYVTNAEAILDRQNAMWSNYVSPGVHFKLQEKLGPAEFRRRQQEIYEAWTNATRTGAPLVTHGGVEVEDLATRMRELDWRASLEQMWQQVLAAYGVPRAVVGMIEDVNRASMEASMLSWLENRIYPLLSHIEQHLTQGIAREFGEDLEIELGRPKLRTKEWLLEAVGTAAKWGAITPNEIRSILLELPPYREGGDTPLLPANMMEAPVSNAVVDEVLADERSVTELVEWARERSLAGRNGKS